MSLKIKQGKGGAAFAVHVIPRANKNEIVGLEGEQVKIRLTAPPVEGEANEALIAFIAETLHVPKKRVEIVGGETSRHKLVAVLGLPPAEVEAKLLPQKPAGIAPARAARKRPALKPLNE
jgi:uncharacterized protein (TIGR00251 family)